MQINDDLFIPDQEFSFSAARSSGPGGQNVNKVSTKAVLTWDFAGNSSLPVGVRNRFREKYGNTITKEGVVIIASDESRSLETNKTHCLNKLSKMILSVAKPPKPRVPTKPSKAAKAQRVADKKSHGEKKRSRSQKHWD